MDIFNEIVKWTQIVSIALFLILFLGKTFYLRRKNRLNVIVLRPVKGRSNGSSSTISVIVVNIWIAFILFYLLNGTFRTWLASLHFEVLDKIWVKIMGLVILIMAFVIFIMAQLALGNSWRLGIDRSRPGKLVTKEIYSVSRHPIYLFFDLYFFSVFLLNANLVFLLFTMMIAVILHFQIKAEERFLIEIYGIRYREYASRVGMYLKIFRDPKLQHTEQSKTLD